MHQERTPRVRSPTPSQTTTVRPTWLPSPASLRVRARVSTLRAPSPPTLLSFRAHAASGQRHQQRMGRDNIVPPHLPLPRTQGSIAHANKPTPEA